ncbi:uncharacterized protein BKCO1_7000182 [Diplodia corticola]|uniref:Uncharacterized protein n=1 Tax=Diplodia corticola TaxID=236234 RepID=A0A1J9RAD6_9PEZI|nr:uncharacterized protein BKCO1_7000182 [Diplodia corticola]OJD37504.1 hypothetical protein BKCO1_7000182 [Diplodia corticola]
MSTNSTHLHPESAAIGGATDSKHGQQQQQHHQFGHHTSASSEDVQHIIADARARGEARAAAKYPSASSKRASSPCPSTTSHRSTDSARRRREAEDGYNPIQYEYEKKGGFRDWWRRQMLDMSPHGAAALVEAVGQGFVSAFGRLQRAGY